MSASQTADMSLLFASQWHLTHIQLVNWGTFCGYKDLRLLDADGQPAQVAMITGESGTGKSTLFDAKTAVLMRSTARFNAASNQTTGRARSARERNLYSYVMGRQDDEYDPATGEARESYLRDPNTANWGAVVLTFACTTGETFCAARFYYVSAHATGVPDTWYLTADEELDPRNMSAHAASKFGRTSLRAAYPAAKIHEGQEAFLRTVWRQLGIGKDGEGDSATRLQERIQAGTTITDVDALFKSLVIDEPSTYEKADEACTSFREHEATWDEMDRARRKTADLADIRGLHKDREAYLAEKALIDSCRPGEDEGPVVLWTCRRRMEVLDTHARACDERVDELDAQIAQREEEIERAKAVLAELEEEVRNRGGGAIDRLERDAQAARNRLGDARDLRRRLEGYLTDIGRALPQDEETFDALMQESEGFLASYDELHGKLEDELLASAVHEQQLAAQERDLASHLQFYEQHPVNITKRMISDRQRISRATGIPEEELPYAAELMDIAEGQEEWRDAANVGFHGLATLMLVDRARLDEFSVRLNRVQLDHRVSFQGVRPRAFKAPRSDANRLSSKIVFARESPFAAWVAEWVHDTNHDYICVDRPEELGGRGQRITREGQTRQRSRGAHGFNRHDTLIIGFTNKARVQEIRSELAGVRAEWTTMPASAPRRLRRPLPRIATIGLTMTTPWAQPSSRTQTTCAFWKNWKLSSLTCT
ncbi:MAG: ATP-binding protein [Atopobiaceae bacterium]|nr:ATP-binding protein [Atopobiaceae bacterium]